MTDNKWEARTHPPATPSRRKLLMAARDTTLGALLFGSILAMGIDGGNLPEPASNNTAPPAVRPPHATPTPFATPKTGMKR